MCTKNLRKPKLIMQLSVSQYYNFSSNNCNFVICDNV